MKDLKKHFEYCLGVVVLCGIKPGEIRPIVINRRATSRWGQAIQNPEGDFTIEVSSRLLDDSIDDKFLDSTIIHEILHTCHNCMNHGKIWKRYANKINKLYPNLDIKVGIKYSEIGIDVPKRKIVYKYKLECLECGRSWKREKASNVTKHPEWYHCHYCKGQIKVTNIYEVDNGLEY